MCWSVLCLLFVFFFKQKTAYEMRISDVSSDVCSSDLHAVGGAQLLHLPHRALALMVRLVAGLGDHAVKRTTTGGQPSLGLVEPGRHRRKDKVRTVNAGMERLLHVQPDHHRQA